MPIESEYGVKVKLDGSVNKLMHYVVYFYETNLTSTQFCGHMPMLLLLTFTVRETQR
jgi:hypothetical protein